MDITDGSSFYPSNAEYIAAPSLLLSVKTRALRYVFSLSHPDLDSLLPRGG